MNQQQIPAHKLKPDLSSIQQYLTEQDYKKLIDIFQTIQLNPYEHFNAICKIMSSINFASDLANLLPKMQDAAFAVLKNLPIDQELPDTPNTEAIDVKPTYISELTLLALSAKLDCNPYLNEDEKNNSIIQNVIPLCGREQEESGSGSAVTFNWHTENIHQVAPTDFFILLGLRGDKNALTSVLPVKNIIEKLPATILPKLLNTNFLMKTGPSYTKESSIIRPILNCDSNGDYSIFYNSNPNRCVALSQEGSDLYHLLQEMLAEMDRVTINIQPGDALIINNHKALHRRDGFKISTSLSKRRWLQRIYLRKNIR